MAAVERPVSGSCAKNGNVSGVKLRMRQSIARALDDAMAADPTVILMGEDVAVAEGPFKTSEGLLDKYGAARVRDTPISEMGFCGAAVGAAATGLRPVVEIMFVEFLGVALDMVVTEAAKLRYLSGGAYTAPMVVRASVGAGLGFGTQHSQTLETWMYATPGLKLAVASGANSAYGLTRAAIEDPDPVVLLEPRVLYGEREEVDFAPIRLGEASVLRRGDDVTIVALGQTVGRALAAADGAPWSADVIDLRTLVPWDRSCVCESVEVLTYWLSYVLLSRPVRGSCKPACRSCLKVGEERLLGQLLVGGFGDAEVDHLRHGHAVVQCDQDVRRLDVAVDDALLVGVLDGLADLDEQFQPLAAESFALSQYSVIGTPWTSSMTKYGRPVSVAPASSTLAMLGWSISASAWRSASKRAMTCLRVHAQLDDLEGDLAADRLVLLGHVDHAHAAFADLLQQLVRAEIRVPGPSRKLAVSGNDSSSARKCRCASVPSCASAV